MTTRTRILLRLARAAVFLLVSVWSISPTLATVTIVNTVTGNIPVVKFDTRGNAVDAHDGSLLQVGSTFYLYGTSYGCGFIWKNLSSPFCGFTVYSSTDLLTWTRLGTLFDPASGAWQTRCQTVYGCFRPHVVYNAANNTYVLWFTVGDAGATSHYRVMTSSSPSGGFVEQAVPTVTANPGNPGPLNGDFSIFVDDDATAYIAFANASPTGGADSLELYVQQLDASYLTGTGTAISLDTRAAGEENEAPAMFRNGSTYYIVYGGSCPYCSSTPTRYRTASTPLGTWSATTQINASSCKGQPAFVARLTIAGLPVYLFGADTWFAVGSPGSEGFHNQGRATQFWLPLAFAGSAITTIPCDDSFTAALTATTPPSNPAVDQSSGFVTMQRACGGGSYQGVHQRTQTFVPASSASLASLRLVTFQSASDGAVCTGTTCVPPNADLHVDLVTVDGTGKPVTTIKAATVPQATIGWSPQLVTVEMHVPITGGATYAVYAYSPSTTGCYGVLFSDGNPYPAGQEYLSNNSGATFSLESNRAILFQDVIFLRGVQGNAVLSGTGQIQ